MWWPVSAQPHCGGHKGPPAELFVSSQGALWDNIGVVNGEHSTGGRIINVHCNMNSAAEGAAAAAGGTVNTSPSIEVYTFLLPLRPDAANLITRRGFTNWKTSHFLM